MVTGIPNSAPLASPLEILASASFAEFKARSGSKYANALMVGSNR